MSAFDRAESDDGEHDEDDDDDEFRDSKGLRDHSFSWSATFRIFDVPVNA
jgi:hypothetical protein